MSLKKVIILFLVLSLKGVVVFAGTIQVHDGDTVMYLGKKLSILKDTRGELSVHEAYQSKGYEQSSRKVPNLGVVSGTVWVKFTIKNNTPLDKLVLNLDYPIMDKAHFYTLKDGRIIDSLNAGEIYPFYSRQYHYTSYLYDLNIQQGASQTVLMKLESGEQIMIPLKIGSSVNILDEIRNKDLIFGIFFGIIFVVFFYNLFIYFTVKDKVYLYYVVYVLFVALTQTHLHGYPYKYLWPQIPWIPINGMYLFPAIVGFAIAEFLISFLKVKTYFPGSLYFLRFVQTIYIIGITVGLCGFLNASQKIIQPNAMLLTLGILVIAIVIFLRGNRSAKFFLVAWFVFLMGVCVFLLKELGILPYNQFTVYFMPAGVAVESILLSLALADRINILKKEKEESQAHALAISQENEKIIREHSVMLEQRVEERTQELQKTNEQLNATLNHLKETQSHLVNSEKMASLGQLTAGVAHEINNPINFVSSNIHPLQRDMDDIFTLMNKYEELIQTKVSNGDLQELKKLKQELEPEFLKEEINYLLKGIGEGAQRTATIVKGLRNFSRVDENSFKYTDINEGLDSTLVLLNNAIKDRIEVVKDYGELPLVECYAGKINQLFMNILNNATQAIEDKGTITIQTRREGDHVVIKISDTGSGMDEDTKNKLFDPFYTTKEVGVGTGLGMSIAYGIIETHNGSIDVESELGKGTTFIIVLPIMHSDNNSS